MMHGVTKETVDKELIGKWMGGQKNADINKFFQSGVTNQCFGLLQGIQLNCKQHHVTRSLSTSLFLHLGKHKGSSVEAMIKKEFSSKKIYTYCKECQSKVKCSIQKRLIALPKSLMVVVDRFDNDGNLNNLLGRVPKQIELGAYLNEENKELAHETKFRLAGFIFNDPTASDYSVVLKNKKREQKDEKDWIVFNKRNMKKVSDESLFNGDISHNAQILLYKRVGESR